MRRSMNMIPQRVETRGFAGDALRGTVVTGPKRRLRLALGTVLVMLATILSAQTPASSAKTLRVKIEANNYNQKLLLDKLKQHGRERQLDFKVSDDNFDYRITFDVNYVPALAGASMTGSYASARVYDANGRMLFGLERNSRVLWGDTDARATDKVAKEIINLLLKVPAASPQQSKEPTQSTPQAADELAKLNAECENVQLTSCTSLGVDYLEGKVAAKDEPKARGLVERTCDAGDARGCNVLGNIYAGGFGVTRDEARGVQLYQRACDGGYLRACTNLGGMYGNGRGVSKDEVRAAELFKQACNDGELTSCTNLALMYANGAGVPRDYAKAAKLSEKACDAGNAPGCTTLGTLYEQGGLGIEKDEAHSAQLYERACGAGNDLGCGYLGDMYAKGHGVRKDKSRAAVLYRKACDLGWAQACMKL